MKVAVISDTHGVLRPEVVERLRGCERIVHAGDVGKLEVLNRLREQATTLVVRGNVDREEWADALPLAETVTWEGVTIHVVHDLNDFDAAAWVPGVRVVVSGHSHQPGIRESDEMLFLNPGSVGPRRFRLPVAMSFLHLTGNGEVRAEMVELTP